MNKYRKKPVVIEAVQLTNDNIDEVAAWVNTDYWGPWSPTPRIFIHTLEGEMMAEPGDWVIKGIKDEFYPCKSDIFEATYELVSEEVSA